MWTAQLATVDAKEMAYLVHNYASAAFHVTIHTTMCRRKDLRTVKTTKTLRLCWRKKHIFSNKCEHMNLSGHYTSVISSEIQSGGTVTDVPRWSCGKVQFTSIYVIFVYFPCNILFAFIDVTFAVSPRTYMTTLLHDITIHAIFVRCTTFTESFLILTSDSFALIESDWVFSSGFVFWMKRHLVS